MSLLRRHMAVILFLGLASLGMLTAYTYFTRSSPPPRAALPPVAAPPPGSTAVPAVIQRYRQSKGPVLIGVIAGHRGRDSGAVCPDGLTEASVNERIAALVVQKLAERGVDAELLDEFDTRLIQYGGDALISLHSDSCTGPAETLSGYKSAASSTALAPLLQNCVEQEYRAATGLVYNVNTITQDMTNYHVFREIPDGVPALILEMGFLSMDRDLLTNGADIVAQGIVNGVICFIERN